MLLAVRPNGLRLWLLLRGSIQLIGVGDIRIQDKFEWLLVRFFLVQIDDSVRAATGVAAPAALFAALALGSGATDDPAVVVDYLTALIQNLMVRND